MSCNKIEPLAQTNEEGNDQRAIVPWSQQRVLQSQDGRTYRIYLAVPPGDSPPKEGYPVIYLLDANAVFGTMVEAVRIQSRRSEKTGVVPAIVIGIGYETDEPFSPARHYDFTMPVPDSELFAKPDGGAWPERGGAESFLRFIEEVLKPMVESQLPINKNRQTIFGHSLGGLFVLHALFAKPTSFQTYIAGSPSIHWNKQHLAQAERQFSERVKQASVQVDLLIGVGELEADHKSRMVDNIRQLADRLGCLSACGIHSEFHSFAGEGHVSVLPPLISRALRFALRPLAIQT